MCLKFNFTGLESVCSLVCNFLSILLLFDREPELWPSQEAWESFSYFLFKAAAQPRWQTHSHCGSTSTHGQSGPGGTVMGIWNDDQKAINSLLVEIRKNKDSTYVKYVAIHMFQKALTYTLVMLQIKSIKVIFNFLVLERWNRWDFRQCNYMKYPVKLLHNNLQYMGNYII